MTSQVSIPQNIDAEKGLIGCFIASPNYVIEKCGEFISEEDFHHAPHRVLWQTILKMWIDRKHIDTNTLSIELQGLGLLEEAGGEYYVIDCFTNVTGMATGVGFYAEQVKRKKTLRNWTELAFSILESVNDPTIENISDYLDSQLVRLSDSKATSSETKHIREVIARRIDYYEEVAANKRPILGLATGLPALDVATRGLRAGNMIVIAAQTKGGKTALALNIASFVAMNGDAVGIFSLEMNEGEIADRLIAAHSRVNLARIADGLNEFDCRRLMASSREISATEIYLRDESVLTPSQFRAAARSLVMQKKCKLLILDYAQLVTPGNSKISREQQVSEISRAVKTTATALGVPIIVMSQLNDDGRSRESRALENDANIFAIIEHDITPGDDKTPDIENSFINLKYTRDCQSGRIPVVFNREFTRFETKE